jgi:cytochrome c553
MNRWHVLLAGWVAFIIGLVVVLGGLIPIEASSGHWRATAWVLDLIKRRSVSFYSMSIEAPAVDRLDWIARGAAHYERGCRPCHGSPAAGRPPIMMKMTPHPPFLPERVGRWTDAELFQIVKHGIKFTGMPSWPAPQRNDEIWTVVAFLRRLDRLSPGEYWRFAVGDRARSEAAPIPVETWCAACHGIDGRGRDGGGFPSIAGQSASYMRTALDAYASGARHSGVMGPIAAALDGVTREAVVQYYASLPPAPPPGAGATARGEAIARGGIPEQRVPACLECHRPATVDRQPGYPLLHAQHSEYLRLQLELLAQGARGGAATATIMQPIAQRLTPEQRHEVALYFASRSR